MRSVVFLSESYLAIRYSAVEVLFVGAPVCVTYCLVRREQPQPVVRRNDRVRRVHQRLYQSVHNLKTPVFLIVVGAPPDSFANEMRLSS